MNDVADRQRHQISDEHWGGWNPQRPDGNDREFLPTMGVQDVTQTEFVNDVDNIPTLNQQQQGSCTGHGGAGITMYDQQQQGLPIVVPSRAMIYYNARIPERTTDQDSGATIRDMVAGLVKYGSVPDTEFPYDDQVYDKAPSDLDYQNGKQQEALVYESVSYPNLNKTLASGFPIVFGFVVYESFESDEVARTGVVPIPEKGERVLGGHCVYMWGFNSKYTAGGNDKLPPRSKACRNSWDRSWGDNGNFYLPQAYFDKRLCSDYWVVRRIGAGR